MDFINLHPMQVHSMPCYSSRVICFEELLDGGDGDGDDDHGDDVHPCGNDVCGDGDDQYHGCHEEDGKSDDGGGWGDVPFCDDDHDAHDVNA